MHRSNPVLRALPLAVLTLACSSALAADIEASLLEQARASGHAEALIVMADQARPALAPLAPQADYRARRRALVDALRSRADEQQAGVRAWLASRGIEHRSFWISNVIWARLSPQDLAELACHIEIEKLGDPVGKQDQYIASYGGLTRFEFKADDTVEATTLPVDPATLDDLEDHLLLFFTGYSRRATNILADQKERSEKDDGAMIANLDYVQELGLRIGESLQAGRTHEFADLMHEHWEHKRVRTAGMSSSEIDRWYDLARANGARGGKLVGAGAGGFLMFYAEDPARVRRAMAEAGLAEVRFRFDFDGAVVLARG